MAQKIEIVRGTSNQFHITVADVNGEHYTLGEFEKLLFGVKRQPSDEEYIFLKTIRNAVNGVYVAEIMPNDTIGMEYGRYIYDVGLESGENYFSVIEASPFVIKPNVTKWGDST